MTIIKKKERKMPNYLFTCGRHETTQTMSFSAHDNLPRDEEKRPFIFCPIKFGEQDKPICNKPSHQVYETAGHKKVI